MKNHSINYLTHLKLDIINQISAEINDQTINKIVKVNFIKSFLNNKEVLSFHSYYSQISENKQYYYNATNFFRKFKQRYSLQGIDNRFLDQLENRKVEILEKIKNDKLPELYWENFHQVKIKSGKGSVNKDLASFFTKLVLTFRPNEYCALDNPIKNYFGLKKEGFFVSFIVLSEAYLEWSDKNKKIMKTLRKELQKADVRGEIDHTKLTDLKILDIIFWGKANT